MKKVSGFIRRYSSLISPIINYRDNIYIFMFLLAFTNNANARNDGFPAARIKSAGEYRQRLSGQRDSDISAV